MKKLSQKLRGLKKTTKVDFATYLGVILAFFGGELLLMCLKTVLNEKKGKDDSE